MTYSHEERIRARSTIRRLQSLAIDARTAAQRGITLPIDAEKAIHALTNTADRSRQVDALQAMGEKLSDTHLSKLLVLAPNEFNAFCEYVNPEEPPESKWHVYLTDLLQRVETEPGNERFVLNCPPGHAKPLAVETAILMGNGAWKRLGDIEVGEYVISHRGIPRRVTAVHEQGTLDVLKITTQQGRQLIAAPDHSFLIKTRHGTRLSPAFFREAEKLRPGNHAVLPDRGGLPNASGKTPNEFKFAAYWCGTGGRTYQKDRSKTFTYINVLLFAREERVAQDMRNCLTEAQIPHTHWQGTADQLHYARLNTRWSEAHAEEYGFDDLASARTIPAFVYQGGDYEVRQFVETYLSLRADCPARYKAPRIHISFNSRAMAQDFQRLFARFSVPSRRVMTGKDSARLVLDETQIEAFIRAGFRYTGENADRLERKRTGTLTRPPASHSDQIKKIESYGKAVCRCLTVEEDETFIAEGLAVHNSTYASRLFVAWRMGRRPRDKVIGGGNSQTFVENEFSKKIRNLVGSQPYKQVFPNIVIDHATRAAAQWALAGTGGQYVAKGAGQAVHGFRANFICVDDPYASIKEAESATVRAGVETWFFVDLGSRLLPNATVFLIMTRFHEEDLTGAVIKANPRFSPAKRYKIVEVPAICFDPDTDILRRARGEVLWDYYNLEHFQTFRATWSYQRFSLVFQQLTDASDEGSIASKLKFYDVPPYATPDALKKALDAGKVDPETGRPKVDKREYFRRIVASVDTASKKTERADYTVIQIWGQSHLGKHYLLDQKRGKWEFPEMITEIEGLAKRYNVDAILVEDKGQGTAYIQARGSTDFQKRLAPAPVIPIQVPSNQGKEFRFAEVTPMIESGEVYVPKFADWIDLFMRELGQFPDGAHDDQVDCLSQYLRWVKTKRTRYGAKKVGSHG